MRRTWRVTAVLLLLLTSPGGPAEKGGVFAQELGDSAGAFPIPSVVESWGPWGVTAPLRSDFLGTAFWVLLFAAGLLILDRVLLWVEARGWIYYRRNKPGRGAATYHLLEWNAAFDPTMRQVLEERVREEIQEEEAGEPPVPEETDT